MTSLHTTHTFTWRDFMCTDIEKAWAFYEPMFGWKRTAAQTEGPLPYTMVSDANDVPLGGMLPLNPEYGLPSHWMGYISVDDIHDTISRATELDGQLCVPPTPIEGLGVFAIIDSPNQSYFSLMQYTNTSAPRHSISEHTGHFCWQELHSPALGKDLAFYQNLFQWQIDTLNLEGWDDYKNMSSATNAPVGGAFQREMAEEERPGWVPYVCVEDVDRSVEQALELNATVVMTPRDIANSGRMALIECPTEERLGLFSM